MVDEPSPRRTRVRDASLTGVVAPSDLTLEALATERGRRGERGDDR